MEVQYVVPTENLGDILAGYYAKKMGLSIANSSSQPTKTVSSIASSKVAGMKKTPSSGKRPQAGKSWMA